MKRIFKISLCCLAAAAVLVSCKNNQKNTGEQAPQAAPQEEEQPAMTPEQEQKVQEKLANLPEEPVFVITTTDGVIKVKLYADTPKHRDNFAKLALSGFYDGILFHRVINGFMIQAGDPLTKDASQMDAWGTGGPGYNISAEIVTGLTHKKGALAAARRGDAANPLRESSGSQFYIVQDPVACSQLDGQYTVFGETIDGFSVIDKIAKVSVDERDRPLNPVKIVSIKYCEPEPAPADTTAKKK